MIRYMDKDRDARIYWKYKIFVDGRGYVEEPPGH